MWPAALPRDEMSATDDTGVPRNPLHNNEPAGADQPNSTANGEAPESRTSECSDNRPGLAREGTWGERDAGIPSTRGAMEDFEVLRHDLTTLSKERSRVEARRGSGAASAGVDLGLFRTTSRPNTRKRSRSAPTRAEANQIHGTTDGDHHHHHHLTHERSCEDIEKLEEGESSEAYDDVDVEKEAQDEEDDEFELDQFMQEGHFEKRKDGRSAKRVGVMWKDLTVKGAGSTTSFVRTLPEAVLGTFGPDLYHLITRFIPALKFGRKEPTRTLIHGFTGALRDGQMMLVLGRPGSGASTFLKSIANYRESYAEVSGEVCYGGIPAETQKKRFRGEVIYNPEDDIHFPSLTVWQTLKFALRNKTRRRDTEEIPIILNALLRMFGISHTKHTLVGNEYVRGVSGGERKRVSIAETLAGKSAIVCWDNSTRGLDSSTALDYARSLRIMTDISNRTTFVTLYQAGESIFELMDRVLLIDTGRCIYNGPAKEAKQYFVDLGFHCPERETTADFLTAVTDPIERQIRPGFEDKVPRTPEELEQAFKDSRYYQQVLTDLETYEKEVIQSNFADAKEFESTTREQKSNRTVSKKSSYTVSFPMQVLACTRREFWLIWGDQTMLLTKFFIILGTALIVGSLFFGQPEDTEGAFSRSGTAIFSILFLGWLQLSELMRAVSGRSVVSRHKEYAFYRPSAVALARVLTDFPMIFVMCTVFCIILYFMSGFAMEASKFWIFYLFVYVTTFCITALYRMFAALSPTIDDAVRFSGIGLNILIIFLGYVIPKPQLVSDYIWFGWLYYVNPVSYAFEAVVTNEFSGRVMDCAPSMLVPPSGLPGVDPANQGCAIAGAGVNAHSVDGSEYLRAQFDYSRSNLWRNFGVLIAWTVLYIGVTVIATEVFSFAQSGGSALVFKKSSRAAKQANAVSKRPADEENGSSEERSTVPGQNRGSDDLNMEGILKSDSIFTWKDVEYTVPYRGGHKKLLNKVSGFVKPGVMTALVGASGAGKTTLLNALAQRQNVGIVSGEILVNGKSLGKDFQRRTGFCEQGDLHDMTATVREALEFSALLRQDRNIPKQEKLDYVHKIVDLLELDELQDAIISSLGVEQRKRLTIGVELAAKPSLLLFLDEPTSGLDSNSAYSIIRFLRKLSHAGQAILCTIHQPSSILISQFDTIFALNPGGNAFYFGPVGEDGQTVIDYFAARGVVCPPNKNVAEFILETAARPAKRPDGRRINWNKEWRESSMAAEVLSEIDRIREERKDTPAPPEPPHEYAASVWTQSLLLTQRVFKQHWRDPSYYYGKLFVSVIIGIFNGFTFWQLGNTVLDMQNRMFSVFLIILLPPTIVNSVVPKFFTNMALWQARELPARIYGWVAFTTAQVVTEIPISIVNAFLYWVLWYWPVGLPSDSGASGYSFLMTMLFFLFQASWGQWITAFAPSFTVISNVLPFFFVTFSLFNGVIRPWAQLPVIWKYWLYYMTPSTYWIGGVLAAVLPNTAVQCTREESALFTAPDGQTCAEYARSFLSAPGSQGFLLNPDATAPDACAYCPYDRGADYLRTINVSADDKWRDFGVFLMFCVTNYMLVYFFIWSVRIKGWSFGFGATARGIGKGISAAINGLKTIGHKRA
ncbi:putative ABC transporter [Lineolata rhizophorae]|uniref:Putative ABC transporter n=1 Tax=Lineolata rhizophorae TaxID=578093 RepID=A0A6A6NPX0_9PEZI|nr:putative ABC transporter [Lineolata rhizophorae]